MIYDASALTSGAVPLRCTVCVAAVERVVREHKVEVDEAIKSVSRQ